MRLSAGSVCCKSLCFKTANLEIFIHRFQAQKLAFIFVTHRPLTDVNVILLPGVNVLNLRMKFGYLLS